MPLRSQKRASLTYIKTIRIIRTLTIFTLLSGCSALPNAYEARLADHLAAADAQMYGTYWCPHCGVQKNYFGAAADRLPYIECDPQGYDPQPDLCAQMGIEAYPTWVINGEYYVGTQLPGKLAALSGFELASAQPPAAESTESGGHSSTRQVE
ncbi:MAG: hypothetical protein WBA76_14865 [Phormidesmis sp.]